MRVILNTKLLRSSVYITAIALKDKKNNISNSLMGETGFLKILKRFFLVYFPPSKY